MSLEDEILVLPPIKAPPLMPIPPLIPASVPPKSNIDNLTAYEQNQMYYEHLPPAPMIYTLPISKPITTRYVYLIHLSHQYSCPIDSLQMSLGPSLQIQIFYLACLNNDWPEMYHMIMDFGVDVNVPVSGGLPALWFATKQGSFEIVQYLLLLGADPNPISGMSGLSALDIANNARFCRTAHLLRAYGGKSNKQLLNSKK